MKELRETIRLFWSALSGPRRAAFVVVSGLVLTGLAAAVLTGREHDFVPLTPPGAAGSSGTSSVLRRLQTAGVEHRKAEDGSILVPAEDRDRLTVELLGDGLLSNGDEFFGWIFDYDLTSTEVHRGRRWSESVRRQLQTMIGSLDAVEQAMVRVTEAPTAGVVLAPPRPAKASVLLKLRDGRALKAADVSGIARLVAGAVRELRPEDVAIVDTTSRAYPVPAADSPFAQSDSRAEAEKASEERMKGRVREALGGRFTIVGFACRARLDLDPMTERGVDFTTDPPATTHERNRESRRVETTPSGTPATDIAEGVRNNRSRISDGGASGGTPVVREEDRERERTTVPSWREKQTQRIAGRDEQVTLALMLDQDEVAAGGLSIDRIREFIKTGTGIRNDADLSVVVVSMPRPAEFPVPGVWDAAAEFLGMHGERILLWMLVLAGFAVLIWTVRGALPRDVAGEIARMKAEFAERPALSAGVAAEAAEERIALIRMGVRDMVQKNPRGMMGIVKKWLKA